MADSLTMDCSASQRRSGQQTPRSPRCFRSPPHSGADQSHDRFLGFGDFLAAADAALAVRSFHRALTRYAGVEFHCLFLDPRTVGGAGSSAKGKEPFGAAQSGPSQCSSTSTRRVPEGMPLSGSLFASSSMSPQASPVVGHDASRLIADGCPTLTAFMPCGVCSACRWQYRGCGIRTPNRDAVGPRVAGFAATW